MNQLIVFLFIHKQIQRYVDCKLVKKIAIIFVKTYLIYTYIPVKQKHINKLVFIIQNKIISNIEVFKENLLSLENPFFLIKTTYAFEQTKITLL